MTVRLVRSGRLYGGVPYAYAAVADTGPAALVYTAGACPIDENDKIVGPGDVRLQARQAVANLAEALAAAGARLSDVLKTTVYVASSDRADLVAARKPARRGSPCLSGREVLGPRGGGNYVPIGRITRV